MRNGSAAFLCKHIYINECSNSSKEVKKTAQGANVMGGKMTEGWDQGPTMHRALILLSNGQVKTSIYALIILVM